jgi:hypothetical protein
MTEGTMCYDRKSFASDSRKAADMDQAKRKDAGRTRTVDALLREARKEPAKPSPTEAMTKEAAPAK